MQFLCRQPIFFSRPLSRPCSAYSHQNTSNFKTHLRLIHSIWSYNLIKIKNQNQLMTICFHFTSKIKMKRSISHAMNIGKTFDMKYFTRSPTMPALSTYTKVTSNSKSGLEHVNNTTLRNKNHHSLVDSKGFRSAVSVIIFINPKDICAKIFRYI